MPVQCSCPADGQRTYRDQEAESPSGNPFWRLLPFPSIPGAGWATAQLHSTDLWLSLGGLQLWASWSPLWPAWCIFTRAADLALAGLEQGQAGQVGTLERLLWSLYCPLILFCSSPGCQLVPWPLPSVLHSSEASISANPTVQAGG